METDVIETTNDTTIVTTSMVDDVNDTVDDENDEDDDDDDDEDEDEENVAALCERIMLDLDNIFKRNNLFDIKSFDIIEVANSTHNRSPVVCVQCNIGLEKWCIPTLCHYAHHKVLYYNTLTPAQRATDSDVINQYTRIVALLHSDMITTWHLRRELVDSEVLSPLDELQLTRIVLSYKPKCASVFAYREWLLCHRRTPKWLINNNNNPNNHNHNNNNNNDDDNNQNQNHNNNNNIEMIQNDAAIAPQQPQQQQQQQQSPSLIVDELEVTLNAAIKYARNYFAWSHRTWLLTVYIADTSHEYKLEQILQDLRTTQHFIERYSASDYSCFHHRLQLYKQLYKLTKLNTFSASQQQQQQQPQQSQHQQLPQPPQPQPQPQQPQSQPQLQQQSQSNLMNLTLQNEFQLLNTLHCLYPDHETLYHYRRTLLHTCCKHWYTTDQQWLNNLQQLEKNFYQYQLKPLLLLQLDNNDACDVAAAQQQNQQQQKQQKWQNVIICRYLDYLKRNLNWSFTEGGT